MKELKMIENELVPVYETSTGEKVVYGSELYEVLEVKSKFADWVKNRLNDCEALEYEDFESFSKILEKGGRPQTEYIIKLDIAKEMAMLERNEKGKQVRRYFIQIEKKYKELANSVSTTYQYPISPAALEAATNAGRLIERVMKGEGIPPHEIAIVIKSIFAQTGIDIPEYFIRVPSYTQIDLIINPHNELIRGNI